MTSSVPYRKRKAWTATLPWVLLGFASSGVYNDKPKHSERRLLTDTINFSSIVPTEVTAFQVEIAELSFFQRSIPLMNHHARQ